MRFLSFLSPRHLYLCRVRNTPDVTSKSVRKDACVLYVTFKYFSTTHEQVFQEINCKPHQTKGTEQSKSNRRIRDLRIVQLSAWSFYSHLFFTLSFEYRVPGFLRINLRKLRVCFFIRIPRVNCTIAEYAAHRMLYKRLFGNARAFSMLLLNPSAPHMNTLCMQAISNALQTTET